MSRVPTDESVVPRFFKTADLDRQASHLASALISSLVYPPPKRGTFGYEWYHTAKFFLDQHGDV